MRYARIFLFNICIVVAGCMSTTNKTPDIIDRDVISYDEYGGQTGGLIDIEEGKYFIITKKTVDLYNALVDKYGDKIVPPLKKNEGITKCENGNNYKISPKYMKYFMDMADAYRMEINRKDNL